MIRRLFPVAGMLLLAAACAPDGARTATAAAPPHEFVVTAGDFFYRAADTIVSGPTRVVLLNEGPEFHHVQLVRIHEGHTMAELLEAFAAGGPPPTWITFVGGPNTPLPGGRTETVLDLEPGDYAILCIIPSPDGIPHLMKGMSRALTVLPATGAAGAMPAADVRMVLDDYAYHMDRDLTAGVRTIRVENAAVQPHEVVFAKLAPGRTAQEMVEWIHAMQGPPPGELLTGTTAIGQGGVNLVTAEFTPGEYALLCFIPDAGDGQPHVVHGMVHQITVR
jgi:hypothetical protein